MRIITEQKVKNRNRIWRIATWNIRDIDILAIMEEKKQANRCGEIGGGHVVIYSRVDGELQAKHKCHVW